MRHANNGHEPARALWGRGMRCVVVWACAAWSVWPGDLACSLGSCSLGACSKTLHVCASATNVQDRRSQRTPQPRLPALARVQQRAWALAALPEGLLCKRQHLPYCQWPVGRSARPFLFRALRLAAIAFAKQGTRCEDFEQALIRAPARTRIAAGGLRCARLP